MKPSLHIVPAEPTLSTRIAEAEELRASLGREQVETLIGLLEAVKTLSAEIAGADTLHDPGICETARVVEREARGHWLNLRALAGRK